MPSLVRSAVLIPTVFTSNNGSLTYLSGSNPREELRYKWLYLNSATSLVVKITTLSMHIGYETNQQHTLTAAILRRWLLPCGYVNIARNESPR